MKWYLYLTIAIVLFAAGGYAGYRLCYRIQVTPLENQIREAERKHRQAESMVYQLAREREELERELIKKMDPADVIDRYLSPAVQRKLAGDADHYTQRIVKSVFKWLEQYIRDDGGTSRYHRPHRPGDH